MRLAKLYEFFTSLKLVVVVLALALVLVFVGTLAQESLGLYLTQQRFFQSAFVDAASFGAGVKKLLQMFGVYAAPTSAQEILAAPRIPVFPGGYTLGLLLVMNLFAAHFRYYRPGFKKLGIALIHLGVVVLLLGQFATDIFSVESYMTIREGESANYSESNGHYELAVVDASGAQTDHVVAIPDQMLVAGNAISHPDLPFTLRVEKFFPNSMLAQKEGAGFERVPATNSFDLDLWWRALPHETELTKRDMPSGIVELIGRSGSLGTYLISGLIDRAQEIVVDGKLFRLTLRPTRFYKSFSLHLLEFRFDRYAGTDIPKNFSSRVRLERPATGERRELTIRMNEPLRYDGETYYQADFDKRDEKGTVLQVVRNPGRLMPYIACGMVVAGMLWQFIWHLCEFIFKRKTA